MKAKINLKDWLLSNPDKSPKDWLMEVCCSTEVQREALSEILHFCDETGIHYKIGYEVNIPDEYSEYITSNQDVIDSLKQTYGNRIHHKNLLDFEYINSKCLNFEEREFLTQKSFDIYFPDNCWYINIGSEIDDAVSDALGKVWMKGDGSDIATIYIEEDIVSSFRSYLKDKYRLPIEEKSFPQEKRLLPWNHEIEASEHIREYQNFYSGIGTVYDFMKALFGEKFYYSPCVEKQIKSRRREKFLASHPVFKEKRENMLISFVAAKLSGDNNIDSISESDMVPLLETADNVLSILYPEYEKLTII